MEKEYTVSYCWIYRGVSFFCPPLRVSFFNSRWPLTSRDVFFVCVTATNAPVLQRRTKKKRGKQHPSLAARPEILSPFMVHVGVQNEAHITRQSGSWPGITVREIPLTRTDFFFGRIFVA